MDEYKQSNCVKAGNHYVIRPASFEKQAVAYAENFQGGAKANS